MPVKRLPAKLLQQLRSLAARSRKRQFGGKQIDLALGRMKNIDHRMNTHGIDRLKPDAIELCGRRVRQMNVSKNFPGVELVLKRTHPGGEVEKTPSLRGK